MTILLRKNGSYILEILKICFEFNLDKYENIGFSWEINKVVL